MKTTSLWVRGSHFVENGYPCYKLSKLSCSGRSVHRFWSCWLGHFSEGFCKNRGQKTSLGEEERNSCSQKSRLSCFPAKIWFTRSWKSRSLVALVSLVFSSLHYAYEKICARATLLDKKINFFYVFWIARTRKVLRKNICFKWAKTSVQIGMNECLVSINMFISTSLHLNLHGHVHSLDYFSNSPR